MHNVSCKIITKKEYKDWRTYHRLYLFDSLAKAAIDKVGLNVDIIPAYQSTLGNRSFLL